MTKAPLTQDAVGPNPTDREEKRSKRPLLVDGRGAPLSLVVTGANWPDVTQLEFVLDEIFIERPEYLDQYLCADRGYDFPSARQAIIAKGNIPHVKRRWEEIQQKKNNPGWKARRWIVEVSHSWFNRFGKILVRFKKRDDTYLALLHMAAAIIAYRKADFIYG
jgi:transposase